jgi:hypothetical protein
VFPCEFLLSILLVFFYLPLMTFDITIKPSYFSFYDCSMGFYPIYRGFQFHFLVISFMIFDTILSHAAEFGYQLNIISTLNLPVSSQRD